MIPLHESRRSKSHGSDIGASNSGISDAEKLEISLQDVDSVLQQLGSLAIAIRRAGSSSRIQKADRTFNPDSYQDFRDHLTLLIMLGPHMSLENCRSEFAGHHKPSRLKKDLGAGIDAIQSRLISVNLRRRHRFHYAQRHASKLEYSTGTFASSKSRNADKGVSPKSGNADSTVVSRSVAVTTTQAKNTMTNTTASEVALSVKNQIPKPQSPSQQARTEISTTATRIVYPGPPAIDPQDTSFRCPCCCLPLESEIGRSHNKWRSAYSIRQTMRTYRLMVP